MNSCWVNPVMLPPGRARLATKPASTGSVTCVKTIGILRVAACSTVNANRATDKNHLRFQAHQLRRERPHAVGAAGRTTGTRSDISAFRPAQLP